MKKVLVWETLATVSGGQKMTLTVLDLLAEKYELCCLIPEEGMLSEELKKRKVPYILMGDQTLPTGVKGKRVIFRYGWMSVKNIWKSLRIIARYKPDILYCPGPAALPWSAICGSLTSTPVIWHLHHIFLDGMTKKLLNLCGSWKSVAKILAVSHSVGQQLPNPPVNEKVTVIYNPVDAQKYSSGDPARIQPEIEALMGRNIHNSARIEKKIVLGHIALIQRSKRQSFVLDILRILRERGYDAIGIFVGECRETEYMTELKEKSAEYGLDRHTVFLGRRKEIPDLLAMLDAVVIPSSFEGFPLAGLEAAAAGVPVVACNVAGAEEFVRVSGDGCCFEENNAEDAADAVILAHGKKEMYSIAGRRFANKCTEEAYQAALEKCFVI